MHSRGCAVVNCYRSRPSDGKVRGSNPEWMDGWNAQSSLDRVPCTPSACSRLFSFLWRTTNESSVISPVTSSVSHCRWFFSLPIPTRSILCASTAIAGPTLSSTSDYTHRVYERHLSSSYYIDEHWGASAWSPAVICRPTGIPCLVPGVCGDRHSAYCASFCHCLM